MNRDPRNITPAAAAPAAPVGPAAAPPAAPGGASHAPAKLPGSLNTNRLLCQWLRILPEGIVEVCPGKVEIGQGIVTALAQIAAEELDVALSRVRMVRARTGVSPDEAVTSGSQSVQECGTALRYAGAEARALLLGAAARRWKVIAATLSVEDGVIVDAAGGRRLPYWELDCTALLEVQASGLVPPKHIEDHRVVGTPAQRFDIPDKVYGLPRYVHDMVLPGMLYGRVLRPGAPGARLQSIADAAARALPGVQVVRDGSFIGVVAEREEVALKAVALLAKGALWSAGAGLPPTEGLHDWMRGQPLETKVIDHKQSPAGMAAGAVVREVSARYTKSFLAHASIGPSCAIAQWSEGRLAVWSHSQGIYNLRADLALTFGIDKSLVTIEHVEGAGCYGHNGADDVALDAALLARGADGRPVQVVWSRADELAWSPHGPAMLCEVKAGLDAAGNVLTWNYEVYSNGHGIRPGRAAIPTLLAARYLEQPFEQYIAVNAPLASGGGSERNAVPLYDFPAQTVTNHRLLTMPLRVSAMRALGGYANIFAIESFIDELALLNNADPLAYRLRHLKDERAIAVLENATRRARWSAWGDAEHEEGAGIGVAWVKYKNTGAYCAVVAEVVVAETVRVKRLVIAVDVGLAINPDGVINQIEGGAIQATSWTLKEAVSYDARCITAVDWESYPILNFSEVPAVDVEIINRPDRPSVGAGEAAQGPTAAAIANAVQNAMGVRVRDLPITPERVVAAM